MSADPNGFTILTTFGPLATKRFRRDPVSLAIVTDAWADAKHFHARDVTFDGTIEDLFARFEALIREPRSFLIRGALRPGVDPARVRRLLYPDLDDDGTKEPAPAFFEHCPRSWIMVDTDIEPVPEGLDLVTRPDEALAHVLGLLPAEFQDADYIALWSSSAGIKDKLAVHLVFLLARPIPDADLRRFAVATNAAKGTKITDPVLYNPVQVHFTAAPLFADGLEDPLSGRRILLRKRTQRTVDPVIPEHDPAPHGASSGIGGDVDERLSAIGGPEGFREPIKAFVGAYVRENGARGTDVNALVQMISARVLEADPGGRDGKTIARYADPKQLAALVRWTMARDRAPKPERDFNTGPYEIQDGRFVYKKVSHERVDTIVLSNFTAHIAEEVTTDDGATEQRLLYINGTLCDGTRLTPARVPSSQYNAMNWPIAAWGSRPVIVADHSAQGRVREAIQRFSDSTRRRTVYLHTGWRALPEGDLVYLHNGGALSVNGNRDDVEVHADGGLADVSLPSPAAPEDVARAVQIILSLGPPGRVLLAAIGRAVLAHVLPVDFTIYLFGPTGVFKTELAAVAQAFFGAAYTARNLPASWSATANALERITFIAKDAVLVIDDFAPNGSTGEIALLHGKAERVLRGIGNRSGRARLNSDSSGRPVYLPRGLVIVTGEDLANGHSLRARSVIVEIRAGDVSTAALTAAQEAARDGLFAATTAAYLRHLAPGLEQHREAGRIRLEQLRAVFSASHRRTPDSVASLRYGLETFARFAEDYGAALPDDLLDLDPWHAIVSAQASHLQSADPVARFSQLLPALFSSGRAHCVDADTGREPNNPGAYGWTQIQQTDSGYLEWRPRGAAIGWVNGAELLLEPDALYAELAELARKQNEPIPLTKTTLYKRLAEKKVILGDPGHTTRERRGLGGTPGKRRVLVHPSVSPNSGAPPHSEFGDSGDSGDSTTQAKPYQLDSPPETVADSSPVAESESATAPPQHPFPLPVAESESATATESATPRRDASRSPVTTSDPPSPMSPMSPTLTMAPSRYSAGTPPPLDDDPEDLPL